MTAAHHVLVVDDDPGIRAILALALRQKGLAPDEAADGRSALELLREHRYAVVLLDLMMPGVDGFGVLNALQTPGTLPPVVIVMTGAGQAVADRVDRQVIHGLVAKPFDPLEVATIVAACVEIRARGPLKTMALATLFSSQAFLPLLDC